MKDGKFDEETAVAKYIEILRARRQYERGIGTATKVEQAIYGISQRMRDWMGNHFGKNWDQVVRESAQGKSWHRAGEVGPDAAMQRQRGAVHTWHPDLVPIEQSRLAYPGERVQQPDLSGLPTMPDGTQVTVAGSMTQQGQPDIPRPLTPAQPPSEQAAPAQATPVPESVTQKVTQNIARLGQAVQRHVPPAYRDQVQGLLTPVMRERDGYLTDLQDVSNEVGLGYKPELEAFAVKGIDESGDWTHKGLSRIVEKLKEGRTPTDLLRATLFLPQDSAPQAQEHLQRVVESMKARGYEVYLKDGKEDINNRFLNPTTEHYRDVALKFTKNGVTRELLLLQEHIWRVKMGPGHELLESLQGRMGKKLSDKERMVLQDYAVLLNSDAFRADNPSLFGGILPSSTNAAMPSAAPLRWDSVTGLQGNPIQTEGSSQSSSKVYPPQPLARSSSTVGNVRSDISSTSNQSIPQTPSQTANSGRVMTDSLDSVSERPGQQSLGGMDDGGQFSTKEEGKRESFVGKRFREIADQIEADSYPDNLLVPKGSEPSKKRVAAQTYKNMPKSIVAFDGENVLLHNPEKGSLLNRLLHLVTYGDRKSVDNQKMQWLPLVPETLQNAHVKLKDDDTGNHVYMRRYEDTFHAVVVDPRGATVGTEVYDAALKTQFPDNEFSRRGNMSVIRERYGLRNPVAESVPDLSDVNGAQPSHQANESIPQPPQDVKGGQFSTSNMRRIPKKYHDRIGSISDERADGNGIWVDLADGWIDPINETHSIHEDTWPDVVKSLKFVEREGDEKFSTLSPVTAIQRGVREYGVLEQVWQTKYYQDAYKRANSGQMKRLDKWVKSQPEHIQEYLERQKRIAIRDKQLQEAVASSGRGSFETAITGKKENRYFDRPRPDDWKERSHYRPGVPEVDQARADFQEANRKATELRKKWDTHARAEETVREPVGPSERLLAELRKQEFIEDEAHNKYMNALLDAGMRYSTLAPNGKPSNLNPFAHRQVRTPEFKRWFGDWEAAAKLKALKEMTPVSINASKLGTDKKQIRHAATRFYKDNLQGKSVTNFIDKREILFSGFGIKETRSHSADISVMQIIPELDTLLKTAVPLKSILHERKDSRDNTKAWHYYAAPIEMEGKRLFVRLVVREDSNGNIYYDNDVTSEAIIQDLTKQGRLDWANRLPKPAPNQSDPIHSIPGLLDFVNPSEVSVLLDENGEPKKMYHATRAAINEFRVSRYRHGIFFAETPDSAMAGMISSEREFAGDQPTDERFGQNIIPVYLSAKRLYGKSAPPLLNDTELVIRVPDSEIEQHWQSFRKEAQNRFDSLNISDSGVREFAQKIYDKEILLWFHYLDNGDGTHRFVKTDSPSQWRGYNLDPLDSRHDMGWEVFERGPSYYEHGGVGAKALQALGYDSAQISDEGQGTVAVFSPEQVKSINNIGTFSDSPNMMFSTLNPDNKNLTPVQRRYQQAAFTSLIRHGNSDAYRREMVEQYGKAVEPLLDQYAADWEIQRGEVLRMLQGAVRDQQSGQRRIGRPDLANPGTTPEARDTMRRVDRARNLDGQPGVRSDEQVEARAQELLSDPDALEAHIHAVAATEDQLNDAETRAARALFNQLHAQAVASGNQRDLERAIAFGNAYRDTGSEQARASRQRQVPRTTKEKANWLRDTLLGPSRKQQEMLDKQRTIMRDKLSTTGVKQAAQRRIDRINKDISRSVQKRLDWMQRNGWDLSEEGMEVIALDQQLLHAFMRDVATDKASFADKVHEFRLSMMLSAPPTHIVNVLSSQAHATWEMTLQRGVEAAINTFVQDPTAAQWGEFKYMFKAAMNPSVWKHAMQNAMLAMDLEAQVLSPKVKGELDWGSGWAESYRGPAIKGKLGRAIRVPLRLLLFEDELH